MAAMSFKIWLLRLPEMRDLGLFISVLVAETASAVRLSSNKSRFSTNEKLELTLVII